MSVSCTLPTRSIYQCQQISDKTRLRFSHAAILGAEWHARRPPGGREVTVMAAAEEEADRVPEPVPAARGAPGSLRRGDHAGVATAPAAAEHPDRRPRDAAAPARFRALLEAYQVLGDPARRAAYDRSLGSARGPAAPCKARQPGAPADGRAASAAPVARAAGRGGCPSRRCGPAWSGWRVLGGGAGGGPADGGE